MSSEVTYQVAGVPCYVSYVRFCVSHLRLVKTAFLLKPLQTQDQTFLLLS